MFNRLAKWLMTAAKTYTLRKADGIEDAVDALIDSEEGNYGKFRIRGRCLWHKDYEFPLAVRTCDDCPSFVVVDTTLIRPYPEGDVVVATGFMRSRLDYEAQLNPEGMERVVDMLEAAGSEHEHVHPTSLN
jgi:hypothetical protein